jgi:FixJ family two-component response regulator
MSLARVISHELQTLHLSNAKPIVFVIDHDVSVRKTLESLIHCGGWQSKTFASAHEFLARPRPTVPSCLVLDVFLPDLNGLELQKRVAVERPNTPIIFITDQPDVYTSVQAMKAGAVEFLVKPFDDDILLGAIQECLKRSCAALSRDGEIRALRNSYAPRTASHGLGGLWPVEQTSRCGARHQRDNGEGAPRPGNAENGG